MVRWFGPFVKEWLSYSEAKLVEWVKSALDHDKLDRISSNLAHSSSVLDIFTSFQQLLDVLKDLDWPNEYESNRFYFAVFYDTIGALYRYSQLSLEAMVRRLSVTREFQPPPASKKAKIGKFRVTIPKMYRKKAGPVPSGQTRLSSETCMLLLNIFAVPDRFGALVNCIPHINDPASVATVPDDDIVDARRFLFSITILDGNLRTTRPYISEVYVKITNSQGKELGMTSAIRQCKLPVWNEVTMALHDTSSSKLTIGIWHRIEGQKDSLYAVGQLATDGIKSGRLTQIVNFENYGSINLSLEILGESREVLCSIINWICENTEKKMISLLVDQVLLHINLSFLMIFEKEFMSFRLSIRAALSSQTFSKIKLNP